MAFVYAKGGKGRLFVRVKDGKRWRTFSSKFVVGQEARAREFAGEKQHEIKQARAAAHVWTIKPRPRGWIYFVQGAPGTPIKIGFTAQPITKRVREMQTGNPATLRALLTSRESPATHWIERELHRCLRPAWIRGEWFRPTPELLAFIMNQGANPAASDEVLAGRISELIAGEIRKRRTA